MYVKKIARLFLKRRKQQPQYLHKWNCLRTAISFCVANNIEGDYLEFGVFRGESFIYSYKTLIEEFERYKRNNPSNLGHPFMMQKIRFFAFDSFTGLPETNDSGIPIHWSGKNAMSSPRNLFENNLRDAKIEMNDVIVSEGYYDKSLTAEFVTQNGLKKAAIINIDCDLYESTKEVLNYITPLIVDGTTLVFDDYFYYKGHPARGERGAFSEWLEHNPAFSATELCKYYPASAFIIHLSNEGPDRMWNEVRSST